jgi:hypothetical protein
MINRNLDERAIEAIDLENFKSYLRASGWRLVDQFGQFGEVYWNASHNTEVILPRTRSILDYIRSLSNAMRQVASVEDRAIEHLYADVVSADVDVVRVRAPLQAYDGTIPIDVGVDLFNNAREMLLSAACAAKRPKRIYRLGGNKDAQSYMSRVRLGQTEVGSYIIKFFSPVPRLDADLQTQLELRPEAVPFERLVTSGLARSLDYAREVANTISSSGGKESIQKLVRMGVSSNLCRAVAEMIENADGIDISFSWARTLIPEKPVCLIRFEEGHSEPLRAAADVLRFYDPLIDQILEGHISTLDRSPRERIGHVRMKTFVEGRLTTVAFDLPERLYSAALDAHQRRVPISVRGDLERKGYRWHLRAPKELRVVDGRTLLD